MSNQETENTNFDLAVIGGALCLVIAVISTGFFLLSFFSPSLPSGSVDGKKLVLASFIASCLSIYGIDHIPKRAFAKSEDQAGMTKRYNNALFVLTPIVLFGILLFSIVSQF